MPMFSTPSYPPLAWDSHGRRHLLAADGPGLPVMLRLLNSPQRPPDNTLQCRLAPQANAAPNEAETQAAAQARLQQALPWPGGALQSLDSVDALLQGLRDDLAQAQMGLRLYLAGDERFIDRARALAAGFGMGAQELQAERAGPVARAVYCVHCKTTSTGVRTSLFSCSGCQRTLMVRDHHARRLCAYMGFQIDAEVPGIVPPVELLTP